MSKPRRITLSALAALAFAVVALPASASANVIVGPSPITFPEREVKSTSDPQTATVTIVCNSFVVMGAPPCTSQDTFVRNPQFFGDHPGDFFAEGGTCPPVLVLTNAPATQCTILIRFKPTAAGQRQATFLAGSSNSGGPNQIVVEGSAVPAPEQPAKKKKKCKGKKGKKKKGCKKKKK
jgi:hypothetical protein